MLPRTCFCAPLTLTVLLALTWVTRSAADKIDLSRATPVPETEPIPILDFFRPQILRSPRLNITGTHIAAIVTPSVDHTELMVYDLKTQKIERIGSKGDSEIYSVDWLNEQRLIYQISVKKL